MKSRQCLFRRYIVCLCFAFAAYSALAGGGASAEASVVLTGDQARALTALNNDRAKHGVKPLAFSAELTALAESYAGDMMARQFFAHNNPEGLTPFDRMNRAGIRYRYAGENLAINDTIELAQTAFMNSPTHRDNVLNPNYTEVGIGVKYAPNGKVYVVQEFIGS